MTLGDAVVVGLFLAIFSLCVWLLRSDGTENVEAQAREKRIKQWLIATRVNRKKS